MRASRVAARFLAGFIGTGGLAMAPLGLAQTASGTVATAASMAPLPGTMQSAAPVRAGTSTAGRLPRADEFSSAAAAGLHCPGDTVVWSSLAKSRSFHLAGSRYYGKTKHGAYVCKADALAFGFHQAKS